MIETPEDVAQADDAFFAELFKKERAGKTLDQLRVEAEERLERWRSHHRDNDRTRARQPVFYQWRLQ